MVIRTLIDKCTTIVKDSNDNYGLNPIIMLNYGYITSRALINFNIDKIKEAFGNKEYEISNNVKHTLHLTNCGSIEERKFHKYITSDDINTVKKRAVSFDIILFKIPYQWDRGVGFDNSNDFWIRGDAATSTDGCNWFNCMSGIKWNTEGIYSKDELCTEVDKFNNKEESQIIGIQHFDIGSEDLSIDITDYVDDLIDGVELNYGIGIAFSPYCEDMETKITKYVGFFSDKTNTCFTPYIESRTIEAINDSTYNVLLNKENRIFLFSNFYGEYKDLDELPICTIDNSNYEVHHFDKGIYYANIKLSRDDFFEDAIYDIKWSNLYYNGEELPDETREFATGKEERHLSIGNIVSKPPKYSVVINGISNREKLNHGEIRGLYVHFRQPYSNVTILPNKNTYYRLYIMSGEKEYTVIDWDFVNTIAKDGIFYVKTDELLPNHYLVDIKTTIDNETRIFKRELEFDIVGVK
jgi:hypothetical protein